MTGWALLPAALVVDALFGDPPGLPHPVRALGFLAERIESALRKSLPPLAAGAAGWLLVVGSAVAFALALPPALGALALLAAAALGAGPQTSAAARGAGQAAASVWLVYVSIAPRDLARHALRVSRALGRGGGEGLEAGRRAVSMIVGRDVERLDGPGVIRAAIESVAESTTDGVCAPLFWALFFGPAGAFAYRAANTLDSMWGHKDERWLLYGRVAARADDALGWLPARLGFFVSIAAAALLGPAVPGLSPRDALRLGWRDRRKHESPNAAWLEASFAGALGLRLGGDAWYAGERIEKPYLGEFRRECGAGDIGRSVALMYATGILFALGGAAVLLGTGAPVF